VHRASDEMVNVLSESLLRIIVEGEIGVFAIAKHVRIADFDAIVYPVFLVNKKTTCE